MRSVIRSFVTVLFVFGLATAGSALACDKEGCAHKKGATCSECAKAGKSCKKDGCKDCKCDGGAEKKEGETSAEGSDHNHAH